MNEVVDCFRKFLSEKDVGMAKLQVGVVVLERDVTTVLVLVKKLFAEFKRNNLKKVLMGLVFLF